MPDTPVTNMQIMNLQLKIDGKLDKLDSHVEILNTRLDNRLTTLTERLENRVTAVEQRLDGATTGDITSMVLMLPDIKRMVESLTREQQEFIRDEMAASKRRDAKMEMVAQSRQSDKPMIILTAATTIAIIGGIVVPLIVKFFG